MTIKTFIKENYKQSLYYIVPITLTITGALLYYKLRRVGEPDPYVNGRVQRDIPRRQNETQDEIDFRLQNFKEDTSIKFQKQKVEKGFQQFSNVQQQVYQDQFFNKQPTLFLGRKPQSPIYIPKRTKSLPERELFNNN